MNESKVVNWRLFNPATPSLFFKSSKNDKASFSMISCSSHDTCEAYKSGCCTMYKMRGGTCPYGTKCKETGYTDRARKAYKWISDRRDRIKDVPQLSDQKGLCTIGDYIYFPYNFWDLDKSITYDASEGSSHIKTEDFTPEFLNAVLNATPRALWTEQVIRDYQNEVAPLIAAHVSERLPDLWAEFIAEYPETAKRFKTVDYVGRKALLKTLREGCEMKHKKGTLTRDGNEVTVENYEPFWIGMKMKKGSCVLTFEPADDASIEITDNDQVDKNTTFVD